MQFNQHSQFDYEGQLGPQAVFWDYANTDLGNKFVDLSISAREIKEFLAGKNSNRVFPVAFIPARERGLQYRLNEIFRLSSAGWKIEIKTAKEVGGHTKADMDVDLTIEALRLISQHNIQHFTLISGDGDYYPLLQLMKKNGIFTQVIAWRRTLAYDLTRVSDRVIELDSIAHSFQPS